MTTQLTPDAHQALRTALADHYAGKTSAPRDPRVERLVQITRDAAPPDVRLIHDPRLDVVARASARMYARDHRWPSPATVSWMSWQVGSPHPYVRGSFRWASGQHDHARLDDALRDEVGALQSDGETLRFGIARTGGNKRGQALILARARVRLLPIPRAVRAGQQIVVRGEVDGDFQRVVAAMTEPGRSVQHARVKLSGDRFGLVLRAPEKRGVYMVELRGVIGRNGQPRLLAHFPIAVDQTPPTDSPFGDADEVGIDDAPERFLAAINAERAEHGLAPARLSPILQRDLSAVVEGSAPPPIGGFVSSGYAASVNAQLWRLLSSPFRRDLLLADAAPEIGFAFREARDGEGFEWLETITPSSGEVGASSLASSRVRAETD